jgi:hypothetical protein
MSETKTLSKVEKFALTAARERAASAQMEFQSLLEEVAGAHGIDPEEGPMWQFNQDFSHVRRVKTPEPPPVPEIPKPEKP